MKPALKDGELVWVRARVATSKARPGLEINGRILIRVPQQTPRGEVKWKSLVVLLKDVTKRGSGRLEDIDKAMSELESRLSALETETEAQWSALADYGLSVDIYYIKPPVTGAELINRVEDHSKGTHLPARDQKRGKKLWTPEEVEVLCREAFAAHHQCLALAWDIPGPWQKGRPTKADWRRAIVAVLYKTGLSNTSPTDYKDGEGLE